MTLVRTRSLLAIALLLLPGQALAGAWTMDQDHGQVIVTGTVSQENKAFDASRHIISTPRYSKFEMQALLEYGLTDSLTLMLAPGYQHVDIAAPTNMSRNGPGYSEFGGRYKFLQGDSWVFSGQATVRAPGTNQYYNPAAIGYTDPEVDTRALFGKSFTIGGLASFIDLQIAQRFRYGDPPNEFRFDATFGIHTAPDWMLMLQSFTVISEGGGTNVLFASYDYSKLQLTAVRNITPSLSFLVGVYTTVIGRNALWENGVTAGFAYKF
jgi:hypothetical protein